MWGRFFLEPSSARFQIYLSALICMYVWYKHPHKPALKKRKIIYLVFWTLPRLPFRKKGCLNSHFEKNDKGEVDILFAYSVTLRNPYKFSCRTKLAKYLVLKRALDGLFRISETNLWMLGITMPVPCAFQWISSRLGLLTIHHNFSGKASKA